MVNAINVVSGIKDKLYSADMVKQLSNKCLDDYDRGVIKGKLDMVEQVLRALENENNTTRTKIS